MKTGIELIAQERKEQIEKHGRTVAYDIAENHSGRLTDAAYGLIIHKYAFMPDNWDREIVNKMLAKSYKDRLVIAGALIAAEIDRIQNLKS